jgi:hypothetical protein
MAASGTGPATVRPEARIEMRPIARVAMPVPIENGRAAGSHG